MPLRVLADAVRGDSNPEGVTLYATASPLAALGLYSARESVALDHGHTVTAGGPQWTGSSMARRRHALVPVEGVRRPVLGLRSRA